MGLIQKGIKRNGLVKRSIGSKKRLGVGVRHIHTKRIKPKKVPKDTQAWIKAIPRGSHGSGHLEQRLWRLKSDFVRIRDWTAFGTFIDTGAKIENWYDAHAGHYRSYAECNGMFKFHEMNIHAQSAMGNKLGTSTIWEAYKANLTRRYGEEFLIAIDGSNHNWPLKKNTALVLKEMHRTLKMLGMMEIKPPYYERVMMLLASQPTTPNVKGDNATQTPIE